MPPPFASTHMLGQFSLSQDLTREGWQRRWGRCRAERSWNPSGKTGRRPGPAHH